MLTELFRERLSHRNTQPFSIEPTRQGAVLCDLAEPRLDLAIKEGALMTIRYKGTNVLLLKLRRRICALALQDVTDQNGMVVIRQGHWYEPLDSLENLKESFNEGKGQIALQGKWGFLRAIKAEDQAQRDAIIQKAREAASQIPEVHTNLFITNALTGVTTTRRAYRLNCGKND